MTLAISSSPVGVRVRSRRALSPDISLRVSRTSSLSRP
jgi:hypothetical protein